MEQLQFFKIICCEKSLDYSFQGKPPAKRKNKVLCNCMLPQTGRVKGATHLSVLS